jgi:DNA-directed RNA polymerase specialized sigma24 family protein
MIDRDLHELPWPAILADLRVLAGQETRRAGAPQWAAEDAAQEACAKLVTIGVNHLPPDLLGPQRGAWLRIVVRNVLRAITRAEYRWREANSPLAAQERAAAAGHRIDLPALTEDLDLSWLPPQEWRVLTYLFLNLDSDEIAELERIDAEEAMRRARWAALRLHVPCGRRTLRVGQARGSLTQLRGAHRRAFAEMFRKHGWTPNESAAELGTSASTVRSLLSRADRSESHEL